MSNLSQSRDFFKSNPNVDNKTFVNHLVSVIGIPLTTARVYASIIRKESGAAPLRVRGGNNAVVQSQTELEAVRAKNLQALKTVGTTRDLGEDVPLFLQRR